MSRFPFPLYSLLLLFHVLLIAGCEGGEGSAATFQETIRVSGMPVEDIRVLSSGNINLAVVDTFLVVQRGQEPFFKIYSTNTHALLGAFGREGRGPGEFLKPTLLKQETQDPSGIYFVHAFDLTTQRLSSINLLDVVNGGGGVSQETVFEDIFFSYFHYRDSELLVATAAGQGRFLLHDYVDAQSRNIPYVPQTDFEMPTSVKEVAYRSAVVVNKEEGLIAAAPYLLGQVDYFNFDGDHVRSTVFEKPGEHQEELSESVGALEQIEIQIVHLEVSNDLIYGLNYNISAVENVSMPSHPTQPVIQVFNWEGDAVRQYMLDNRILRSFAVDPVHDRIYAYAPYEEKQNIITYELK